jgi:hypothetical protein
VNDSEKRVAVQKTGLRFLSMSTNEELNSKSRYYPLEVNENGRGKGNREG